MECLIISGMSGAGKSMTVDVLEDLGYYCIDNMPTSLIPRFVELFETSHEKYKKVALVVDVRGGSDFEQLYETLKSAEGPNFTYRVVFLDASSDILLNRHKETRRRHPLESDSVSFSEAISRERELLEPIKSHADFVIDTSALPPIKFREYLASLFDGADSLQSMMITVGSFGFKHGIPTESDMVFDVRFLKNPYYIEELKYKTGLDSDVFDYVFADGDAGEFVARTASLLEFLIPRYIKEGRMTIVISIGCTGGHHRSVSIARELAQELGRHAHNVNVRHRDISK